MIKAKSKRTSKISFESIDKENVSFDVKQENIKRLRLVSPQHEQHAKSLNHSLRQLDINVQTTNNNSIKKSCTKSSRESNILTYNITQLADSLNEALNTSSNNKSKNLIDEFELNALDDDASFNLFSTRCKSMKINKKLNDLLNDSLTTVTSLTQNSTSSGLLDISNCSSAASPMNLNSSIIVQSRRCLFREEQPQQDVESANRPVSPQSNKSKLSRNSSNITPISVHKNIISIDEEQEEEEDFIDYSLNKIENELDKMKQNHEMIMESLELECSQSAILPSESVSISQQQSNQTVSIELSSHLNWSNKLISMTLDTETTYTSNARLIGDRSAYHVLPCKTSIKHNDLNVIDSQTLTKLIDGQYNEQIEKFVIIDARYPYEFDGGHIRNAMNIYTKEKLLDMFITNRKEFLAKMTTTDPKKRFVIIFHCEFSSERGPSMLRFLRNQDRAHNRDSYPKLFYPELYLLEGGYKEFFNAHKQFCEPQSYKPMLHEDHVQDLKHFRAKTKTWEQQNKYANYNMSAFKSVKSLRMTQISSQEVVTGRNLDGRNPLSKLQRFPKSTLF